jgi:hypothetical protein
MQGKTNPTDVQIKVLLDAFNTPGNEIAPRSDVIRKYFQYRFQGSSPKMSFGPLSILSPRGPVQRPKTVLFNGQKGYLSQYRRWGHVDDVDKWKDRRVGTAHQMEQMWAKPPVRVITTLGHVDDVDKWQDRTPPTKWNKCPRFDGMVGIAHPTRPRLVARPS